MRRKIGIILAAAVLAVSSLACGVTVNLPSDGIVVGRSQTEKVTVPWPDTAGTPELKLEFGAGEMNLLPGAAQMVEGSATYNVEQMAPKVNEVGDKVVVSTGSLEYTMGGMPNVGDVVNIWDLRLGSAPMTLTIDGGAFEGELNLGGLALEELNINSGASALNINFDEPNTILMEILAIKTGASSYDLTGLANTNASTLTFEGGLGDYSLDFGGTLQQEMEVEITVGASTIEITLPEGVAATLDLEGSLNDVTMKGDWSGAGDSYYHPGDGLTIHFDIQMALGTLKLGTE